MLLYAYFTPKVDFKRKFNHHQSFICEWRLTARTIRKFRIGPSIRIESQIGRTIRNRIESRSFVGPYFRRTLSHSLNTSTEEFVTKKLAAESDSHHPLPSSDTGMETLHTCCWIAERRVLKHKYNCTNRNNGKQYRTTYMHEKNHKLLTESVIYKLVMWVNE